MYSAAELGRLGTVAYGPVRGEARACIQIGTGTGTGKHCRARLCVIRDTRNRDGNGGGYPRGALAAGLVRGRGGLVSPRLDTGWGAGVYVPSPTPAPPPPTQLIYLTIYLM